MFNFRKSLNKFLKKTHLEKTYLAGTEFFNKYAINRIIPFIPSWTVRKLYYKLMGVKIGNHSFIDQGVYILGPKGLKIGNNTHINQGCFLDARGGLTIGNDISISHYAKFVTGGHDWNSPYFDGKFLPIVIEDYAWIGVNAIIMQGISVKEGAVIGTGSILTKDAEPYYLYLGIPAKKIKERNRNLLYHPLEGENHFRYL